MCRENAEGAPGVVQAFSTGPRLDPETVPKFSNRLVVPPVYKPRVLIDSATRKVRNHCYKIKVSEFWQQILPEGFPLTMVWGYSGTVTDPVTGRRVRFRGSPGATFKATRGVPVRVRWVNDLTAPHHFAVDPTLHWANPNHMPMDPSKLWPLFPPGFPDAQSPVPIVTHLHGGEVHSTSDGYPDAWFTHSGLRGPQYYTSNYNYPNDQQSATLWYHDHALGITRINVYSGLAGFYIVSDPCNPLDNPAKTMLPKGKYDVPLVIQDRSFNADGSFFFDSVGDNPDVHPYWTPEFFGDSIMVNGRLWPDLKVKPRTYRFRLLNGSNARFYHLNFSDQRSFVQISSDGGYLPRPVTLTSLLLAPGERADILVNFSRMTRGSFVTMMNDARAPYPDGDLPNPGTTGTIMRFTLPLNRAKRVLPRRLPSVLNFIPTLRPDAPARTLTLNEVMGDDGPTEILLNGQKWSAPISELPRVGSTEDWQIVNLTGDTHPIHLHLAPFQVVSRQELLTSRYVADWTASNGEPPLNHPTVVVPVEPYLMGSPRGPEVNEHGWKDTVQVNPGEVLTIRIRFAPSFVTKSAPGMNLFPFDPTTGPGYVWHCHILDHEDNEMMRPYRVTR